MWSQSRFTLLGFALMVGLISWIWFGWPHKISINAGTSQKIPMTQGERSLTKNKASGAGISREEAREQGRLGRESIQAGTQHIRGQVVDPAYQGIEGASILVHTYSKVFKEKIYPANHEGYFALPHPQTLPIVIQVSAPGFTTRRVDFPQESKSQPNTIILNPGGQLELVVQDEAGHPIANAAISSTVTEAHTTNTSGQVTLTHLADPAHLLIQAEGFNDLRQTLPLEVEFQEVTLLRNGYLHGLVLDAKDDTPIAPFKIKIRLARSELPTFDFDTPNGHFEIDGLSRKQRQFIISAPGYISQGLTISECLPKSKSQPLEIRLSNKGISFAGIVLDDMANKIEGATITAFIGDKLDTANARNLILPKRINNPWVISFATWIDTLTTISRPDGTFEIGPLPENTHLGLITIAPGFAPSKTQKLDMLVGDGRHNLRIVLIPYGSVDGEAGQEEVDRSRIIAIRDSAQQLTKVTLLPGQRHFRFEEVRPGLSTLKLYSGPGDHLATGELPPIIPEEQTLLIKSGITQSVRIGFSDKLQLGGRILLDGQPMANARVVIFQKKTPLRYIRIQTDEQGQFHVFPLGKGPYEIMANGSLEDEIFGTNNRKVIQLQSDMTDLLLEFESMGNVFGRVLGEPVGARLTMQIKYSIGQNTLAGSRKVAEVQPGGYFEFNRVPGGQFQLTLDALTLTPQILVQQMVMPDDGSDLDLGDLGKKPGQVRLWLAAPATHQRERVIFYQYTPTEHGPTRKFFTQFEAQQSPQTARGLSSGPFTIETSVKNGFRVDPTLLTVTIDNEGETDAHFQLIPETYLQIRAQDPGQIIEFKSAQLRHEASGRRWAIPMQTTDLAGISDPAAPQFHLTSHLVFARAISSGWWVITLENQDGLITERRFQLQPGYPVIFPIANTDFAKKQ